MTEQTVQKNTNASAIVKVRRKSLKKKKLIADIVSYFILGFGSLLMIMPLVWMFSASLKVDQFHVTGSKMFDSWHFVNYVTIFKQLDLVEGFKNSVIVVVPSVIVGSYVSGLAAYAFAKIRFKFKNAMFMILLATVMIPFPVIMIPQYYIFTDLDWIETLLPLIIPKMLGNIMMIFFVRQFLAGVPDSIIESGKIDGAGHFRIFNVLILPVIMPALSAQLILWFMAIWNDYLAPYMFSGGSPTLPVIIASLISYTDTKTETHLNMAASLVSMLPILIVFAIFQRQIIESVVLSGSKE